MRTPTKGRFEKRVKEVSGWIAAALIGGGIALSLSLIFLAPGVVLLALGVGVAVVGRLSVWVVPFIMPHRDLACPYCQQVSQVFSGNSTFRCDGCLRDLSVHEALPVPHTVPDEPATFLTGRRMLILFAALSFVAFFVEIYLGHYGRLQLFQQKLILSAALVPFFFSPVALVVCLVAATRITPTTVRVLNSTMLASIVVGMGGTYFHVAARITSAASLVTVSTWLGDPPAFAPFAFALPGIMGLVATFGIRWVQRLPEPAPPRPAPMHPAAHRAGRS
jgi:hypothetical protein